MNSDFSKLNLLSMSLAGVGTLASIIGLVWAIKEGKKASAEFAKANEEFAKANSEYVKARELSDKFDKLVAAFKGTILNWEDLVKDLAEEIYNENESIMMALDTLAYGVVSVPNAYDRFWANLVYKAASRTPMQIITFNEKARMAASRAQHGGETVNTSAGPIKPIEQHFANLATLKKEGKGAIRIILSDFFPLHLFIFASRNVAIFAIQEIISDGSVKSYALRTQDPVLMEICRRIFTEMLRNSEVG
ncbi:MAG: hypothetical protein QOF62_46 [Pyrinomonadaceae bacterium]|jgi:hypothetical protein|nr:hypothetical protein [Pyrinomonadaceae bacterium]